MSNLPNPLTINTSLNNRYRIQEILGQNSFNITYLAKDFEREDLCVIKELAPIKSIRIKNQALSFECLTEESCYRLKNMFLEQVKIIKNIHIASLLPIRDIFYDKNTVYYVRSYLDDIVDLKYFIENMIVLEPKLIQKWLIEILDLLIRLSNFGVSHRNIKPSNIFFRAQEDQIYLVDFDFAKQWYADSTELHEYCFKDHFSPPEQKQSNRYRSEFTDIFSLSATAYCLLTSESIPLDPHIAQETLYKLYPNLEPHFIESIAQNLHLNGYHRQLTFNEFKVNLEPPKDNITFYQSALEIFESKFIKLHRLHPKIRECPNCNNILENIKPLKIRSCPSCHEGKIQHRNINQKICANCKIGILKLIDFQHKLNLCPQCQIGILKPNQNFLLKGKRELKCENCTASYVQEGEIITEQSSQLSLTKTQWLSRFNRANQILLCDSCNAQFDILPDSIWEMIYPKPKTNQPFKHLPQEWARIAIQEESHCGNAFCDQCDADYHLESKQLTLLNTVNDYYNFGKKFKNQNLDLDTARWFAISKLSKNPGLTCSTCYTEFDQTSQGLCLIHTTNLLLSKHVGKSHQLENWHRIAHDLPFVGEEDILEHEVEELAQNAYASGNLNINPKNEQIIWMGHTIYYKNNLNNSEFKGSLSISKDLIICKNLLNKLQFYIKGIDSFSLDNNKILFKFSDLKSSDIILEIIPIIFNLRIGSLLYPIELRAEHLFSRLNKLKKAFEPII